MPDLQLVSVDKAYGNVRALVDLSLDVRAGEILGFVGANGAGKTTAMRIALGVLGADRGTVLWDGRPVDLRVRRRIGYMPEERGLYPRMKVAEQLVYLARLHGMPPGRARRSVERWTEVLGVAGRRGDEVQKLSLGNQQRVQLAAALVHDPDILVLDEPFSGLDPVAVDVMSTVLRDRADAGVPVVFSSHQLDLVERLSDRVAIVRDGSLVALGSIEQLRTLDRPRWLVDGPPASAWLRSAGAVAVLTADGPRTVVELPDARPAAEQQVLRAALAAGPVREFRPVRPSLVELYRHVVSEHHAEDEPETGPEPGDGPAARPDAGPAARPDAGVAPAQEALR
ncbi:MAG TPA: ATP-binding cassette domain-containing protein [Dermatophilaceae bacterium]|nr:ATP-binding cassette domain-containing protein [Dermatophilaceae bacterium]